MSPMHAHEMETSLVRRLVTKPTNPDGLILEAWAQGYMVGSLIIMACITISNMRRGVLLHKLILLEVCPVILLLQGNQGHFRPQLTVYITSSFSAYGTASSYSSITPSITGGCQSAPSPSTCLGHSTMSLRGSKLSLFSLDIPASSSSAQLFLCNRTG